ncbi:MAG TPA: response regulator transcription factor, partial [Myxococcota bacterium]|nr:response regulator transcription factor [Myxococcota bacterium]
MPRVLVVEDDDALRAQIVGHLEAAGYEVIAWREGHHVHPDAPPDVALVVLDLMLPRVDGLQVLSELRATSDVPVLVLSARDDTQVKVRALKLGADDYLTKPFWPEELVERVRARVRRPVLQRGASFEVGPLRIDVERREVHAHGVPVELTRVEFDLLIALARRPGTPLSRQWLVHNVLDPDREGTERTLDVHVSRLRRKLGEGMIETVWG